MTWNDGSSAYAGVFFRVTGGNAFGQTQNEDSPRLIQVQSNNDKYDDEPVNVSLGAWSGRVASGKNERPFKSLQFLIYNVKVRSHNMAISVWKRTG
jgi:hypothetical protein